MTMVGEFLVIVKDGRFYGGMHDGCHVWVLGVDKAQHFHVPRRVDQMLEFLEGAEVKVVRAEYTIL